MDPTLGSEAISPAFFPQQFLQFLGLFMSYRIVASTDGLSLAFPGMPDDMYMYLTN